MGYLIIVGYASSSLTQGATITAAQFFGVGTDKVPLQSFTGLGEEASYGIYLDLLSPQGIIIKQYVWVEDYGENGDQKCWLDGDTYELPEEEVGFDAGQGFWIEGQNANQTVQSAGQVPVTDATIQLCQGATMGGNFTPVAMNLQDIIAEGTDASYGVYLDLLNPQGIIVKQYVWVEDYGENGDQKCWLDGDTYELPEEEVTFAPGQGFWIEGQNDEQFITFPGVELN